MDIRIWKIELKKKKMTGKFRSVQDGKLYQPSLPKFCKSVSNSRTSLFTNLELSFIKWEGTKIVY